VEQGEFYGKDCCGLEIRTTKGFTCYVIRLAQVSLGRLGQIFSRVIIYDDVKKDVICDVESRVPSFRIPSAKKK